MTDETRPAIDEISVMAIALAHVSMLAQAARGEYRPRPGEIDQRQAWLTSLIRTGEGLVTDADREIAAAINRTLSQLPELTTQSEAIA